MKKISSEESKSISRQIIPFRVLSLVLLLIICCFVTCKDELSTTSKKSLPVSTTNVDLVQKSLVLGNRISVLPGRLFYSPGNTITFTGKITDFYGKGISGVQVGIDNPVSLMCTIGPKTDKDGKFVYNVSLPSTSGGIYAFAFYYGGFVSFSAIAVTPVYGLKLTNSSFKIPLGVSSSYNSFDLATLTKIPSKSGYSKASQDILIKAADQIASFGIDAGRKSLEDFNSNPATKVIMIASVSCTETAVMLGGEAIVACTPLYTYVLEEAASSILVGIAKTAIEKSKMSIAEKQDWENSLDLGICYLGVVGLNPEASVLNSVKTFSAGWTCGTAAATIKLEANNKKSLKIIATPAANSTNQNVGGFIFLRENRVPNKPSTSNPSNGAVNLAIAPILNLSASDPDGDALKYDIYFGESISVTKKLADQTGTTYKPGTLLSNKTYYWKIVAKDGKGGETSGDLWHFTTIKLNTAPNKPSNPSPSISATNITMTPTLNWTGSDPDGDALKYDIYFGDNTSASKKISDQTGTSYKPGTLTANKVYYWKVVAKDGKGGETSGDWWSFTTIKPNSAPNKPAISSPLNGAISISVNPKISWTCSDPDKDALKYDIYFGTSTSAATLASNLSATSYQLSNLTKNKKYYWRIIAKDGRGGETSSDWWYFTSLK